MPEGAQETLTRFRPKYRKLTDEEQQFVDAVKNTAEIMEAIYDNAPGLPDSRSLALAMTKLEESVMWAVKGVTG